MADSDKTKFVNAIRSFVHMDNLAETHARQAANAREARAVHEAEALRLMHAMGIDKSTIQVTGGTSLRLVTQRTPSVLTWTYLEKECQEWARSAGVSSGLAASLVQWLRDHRDIKEAEHLKKTTSSKTSATSAGAAAAAETE